MVTDDSDIDDDADLHAAVSPFRDNKIFSIFFYIFSYISKSFIARKFD